MPDAEGLALCRLAELTAAAGHDAIVEIGAWCGRSALYMAAGVAAAPPGAPAAPDPGPGSPTVVISIDHHHGSEENQAGWEHHDPALVDERTGRIDTLPFFRAAIGDAGAEDLVVAVVGDSATVARRWGSPVGLVFIDGGHGEAPAWADYRAWAPKVGLGCILAIHDVFPDPSDGGRPPYELYRGAVGSGAFVEEETLGCGSLRVLRRVAPGL
ncbi:MAG: class I SAM-dependent methyltransferase [Acidimicrobiales bacterium]